MSEQKDISMLDVSNALDSISNTDSETAPPQRRKSTLILTDDAEKMHLESNESPNPDSNEGHEQPHEHQQQQQHQPQPPQQQQDPQQQQKQEQMPDPAVHIPVEVKWVQGGEKVYVTGSFTGWRKMIGLQKQPDNTHVVTLGLPVGTHRFRFVIDNELRFSDHLPTATDQMGNFVNYIEVTPENVEQHLRQQQSKLEAEEQHERERQQKKKDRARGRLANRPRSDSIFKFINDDDDMGDGYSRYYDDDNEDEEDEQANARKLNYINDIPPIFVEPKVMEQYYLAIDEQAKSKNTQQQGWLHPPQLPPQLDNVILNNFNSMDKDNNSGALPIPNHVVLNHLATTSIKHNTLAVASVVRYKRKYVTQVLYAPLQQ